jgi:hypothetical protein
MKTKSLHLIVFVLPLMVLVLVTAGKRSVAQEKKEQIRTVTISKGDTIINGKQFSKLDKKEREKLRKELREMEKNIGPGNDGNQEIRIVTRNRNKGQDSLERKVERRIYREVVPGKGHVFRFEDGGALFESLPDSVMALRIDSLNPFHGRVLIPRDFSVPMPNPVPRMFARPGIPLRSLRNNSQSFSFRNVDKEGIATNVSIQVSDAEPSKVKELSGKEKADLEVHDLTFAARFSSGEIAVMFTLPAKASADVKLYDSSKKLIFSERTTGSFSRNVSMAKNGVYYLVIDQNSRVAVKRIVKQ